VTQFADGLVFDLTDPLTGNAEDLTHFFQGVGAAVVHTEPHTEHIGLPFGKGVQNLLQGFGKQSIGGGVGGTGGALVLHEGADGGVLFITHRGIQAQGVSRGAVCLDNFLHRQPQLGCNFFHSGFTAQLLHQFTVTAGSLVNHLNHMHRHPNGTGLVGYGSGNGLPNPPGGICREFVSLCPVKFVHRADQTGVALLDQIQNVQSPAAILLSDGNHQTEVCLGELILGVLAALGHHFSQFYFLFGAEQLDLTDFLQIHPHRVVQIVFGGQIHRVNQLFLAYVRKVDIVVQILDQFQPVAQIQVQILADHLDVHSIKAVVNLFNFFRSQVHLFQMAAQLRIPNHTVLTSLRYQLLQRKL